jgi:hypothetical protein
MNTSTTHEAVGARSLARTGSGQLASVDSTVRRRRLAAVRMAMTRRDQSWRRDAHAPRATELARLIAGTLDLQEPGPDATAQPGDEDALAAGGL